MESQSLLKLPTYSCGICFKTFVSATTLESHMFQHSGKEPFQCDICGKTFIFDRNCRTHAVSHVLNETDIAHSDVDIGSDPLTMIYIDRDVPVVMGTVTDKTVKTIKETLESLNHTSDRNTVEGRSSESEVGVTLNKGGDLGGRLNSKARASVKHSNTVMVAQIITKNSFKNSSGHTNSHGSIIKGPDDDTNSTIVLNVNGKKGKERKTPRRNSESQVYGTTLNVTDSHIQRSSINIDNKGKQTQKENDGCERRPVSCTICKKLFAGYLDLKLHMTNHKCEICDVVLPLGKNRKHHMELIHAKKADALQCEFCEEMFVTDSELKIHVNSSHKGKELDNEFHCSVCQRSFSNATGLAYHMNTHTGEKTQFCEVCKKGFAHPTTLRRHMMIHTGEKPYTCEKCEKDFRCSSHLSRHMVTHLKSKPYSCKFCRKRMKGYGDLKRHQDSCQTSLHKLFNCNECGMLFKKVGQLKHHLVVHAERKFVCEICDKRFSWRTGLRDHMATHSTEKKHICGICDKAYGTLSALRKHKELTHDREGKFVCDYCDREFKHASALKDHEAKHEGGDKDTRTHW